MTAKGMLHLQPLGGNQTWCDFAVTWQSTSVSNALTWAHAQTPDAELWALADILAFHMRKSSATVLTPDAA